MFARWLRRVLAQVVLGAVLGIRLAAAPGEKLWTFRAGGFIRSTPTIGADGTVYFGSGGGGLYAVNGTTGGQRWKFPTGPIIASPALGTDGTVYVGEWESLNVNQRCRVYAVSALNGAMKWSFNGTDEGFRSSPAIGRDGVVYVASERGWLYALAAGSGQEKWRTQIEDAWGLYSSPVVGADGTVYIGSGQRGLFALEPVTGRRRWAYLPDIFWNGGPASVGGFHASPALGADGTLYLGSTDESFYAFDGFSGAVKWRTETGGPITSSASIGPGGTAYFGSDDGRVYAVDGATGLKRWNFLTGGAVHSTPALTADGALYFGSYDKKVYALNATNGSKLWEFATGGLVLGSAAVGEDGTVFIGSYDSNLYALEGTSRLADSPWSSFRGGVRNQASAELSDLPKFLTAPTSHFVAAGSPVTLGAIIGGDRPMEFEWFHNGQKIDQANDARLTLSSPQVRDTGEYRVLARNAHGQAQATLTLTVGFRLTIGQRGGGTLQANPVKDLYLPNSQVVLTVIPDEGRTFLGWLGDAEGQTNPLIVTLNRHRQVAAEFDQRRGEDLWEFGVGDYLNGPPAIGADGTLYIVAGGRWPGLYALHAATGKPLWELRGEEGEGFDLPVVSASGTVHVVVSGNTLLAINAVTGLEKWRYRSTNSWISSYPAIGPNGWVYVRVRMGIRALDGESGQVKWNSPVVGDDGGQPLVVSADGTVYVAGGESRPGQFRPVVALDGVTGKTKWSFAPAGRVWSTPIIGADGTIYFTAEPGRFYAVDGVTGAQRWRLERSIYDPVIGVNGTLFGRTDGGETLALQPENGEVLWRVLEIGSLILGADDTVYIVATGPRRLLALDMATGNEKWRREWQTLPEYYFGSPTLGPDGTLYLKSDWPDHKLYAIQATSGLAQTAWPKYLGSLGNTSLGRGPLRINATLDGSGFTVSVPTLQGQIYRLEFRSSLNEVHWSPLAEVQGDGLLQQLVDPGPLSSHRFYRVRSEAAPKPPQNPNQNPIP
jgi:outer membrane protein assembly factor BamB